MIEYGMFKGGAGRCQGTRADGQRCARSTVYVATSGAPWYCYSHGKTHDERGRKIPVSLRNEPRS